MNVLLSEKFSQKWDVYFEYCVMNYCSVVAKKKYNALLKIIQRLSVFPEIGFLEPLLKGGKKNYFAIVFDKKRKIIYSIEKDKIVIENLWDMRQDPKKMKNDF